MKFTRKPIHSDFYRVYYYFYERSRDIILKSRKGSKALSTPESMLIGLIAGKNNYYDGTLRFSYAQLGSATTMISNPIWVIQTSQTVHSMPSEDKPTASSTSGKPAASPIKKLNIIETINHILKTGGLKAFWRGIGPALILVINPVLQYTVFEQLKNALITSRTLKLRASGVKKAVATLTDLDFFLLGAVSKLGEACPTVRSIMLLMKFAM